MTIQRLISTLLLLTLCLSLAACAGLPGNPESPVLKASGTISADTIQVAAEISGKIVNIKVDKGAAVKAGDLLFQTDDTILKAQSSQADAAVKLAQVNLDMARQKLVGSQVQYDLAIQAAHLQDLAVHTTTWKKAQPEKITLPTWYFNQQEQIDAARVQLDSAQKNLNAELANLNTELKNASNKDFVAAEKRLAQAQAAYVVNQQTLDEAKAAKTTASLQDAAQKYMDSAQADLDSAQKNYDQLLSSDAARRVLEARARFAVARELLNNSQDAHDKLMTRDESLQVDSAQSALDQAKTGVTQAEASLTQALAALQVIKVQLDKTTVSAPASGIVLSRPLNAGEVAAAGATVVEIGSLDQVTLTVYFTEAQFGRIQLGQKAKVSVDSFPARIFEGQVSYIADRAEFTPRNVQTVESRSTTVYKIEITLPNPSHELKLGMPADATF
jgi:HlyD family secretion protein